MKLIKVEHAYKIYKNGTTAVADLSVSIDKGEFVKDPRNIYGENLSLNLMLGVYPQILYCNYLQALHKQEL